MKEIIPPTQIITIIIIFEEEEVSGEGGQGPSLQTWHVKSVGVPTEINVRFQAGVGCVEDPTTRECVQR